MNPFEEKLTQFVNDEVMYSGVKNILLSRFDLNTLRMEEQSLALIGETAASWIVARRLLGEGFKDIEKYRNKRETVHTEDVNPAV